MDHEGVHERRGEVPAGLAPGDVVLLGEQPARTAGGAIAFEPPSGLDGLPGAMGVEAAMNPQRVNADSTA